MPNLWVKKDGVVRGVVSPKADKGVDREEVRRVCFSCHRLSGKRSRSHPGEENRGDEGTHLQERG